VGLETPSSRAIAVRDSPAASSLRTASRVCPFALLDTNICSSKDRTEAVDYGVQAPRKRPVSTGYNPRAWVNNAFTGLSMGNGVMAARLVLAQVVQVRVLVPQLERRPAGGGPSSQLA
jgi:hypothetical protein